MIVINFIQLIFLFLWTFIVVFVISPFLSQKGAYWLTIHVWSPGVAIILFSRIRVEGVEHLSSKQHYIFMANHASYFDIACLFFGTKRRLHFIAKEELNHKFITGYMLRKLDMIFIDRTNTQRSVASMKKAVDLIQQGRNVAIFPEGTRTKNGKLGVFKKGGFKLAVQSQTPIVPVSIKKSNIAWPRNNIRMRPTTVTVYFGTPIETIGKVEQDIKQLSDEVIAVISHTLQE